MTYRVVTGHQVFAATEDLHIAAGVIRYGTASHLNLRWRGIVGGEPRLTLSIHWHMETAHLEDPEPHLWRIRIDGEPGVRISVDLVKRAEDWKWSSVHAHLAGTPDGIVRVWRLCAAVAGAEATD